MRTPSIKRLLALATLTVALGACGDSTGSENSDRGEVEFSYSGAESGQFDASGALRNSSQFFEFAAGFVSDDGIELLAVEETGNDRGNFFLLLAPDGERTSTCSPSDDPIDCEIFAGLLLGIDDTSEEYDRSFSGYVGTVTVTEITERRVRGTFSLTMEDDDDFDTPLLQVRSGSFDVPIMDEDDPSFSSTRATAARLSAGRQGSARR